ncbi:hypothetical protein OHV05_38140 (plasmid) [Kitasatospora sp. NBC_00070]|uniref:hypothetical protein n=1 Tax=Kitasatospora sp. NBC_00070 TaxID=2975962 RepID=UPI002F91668D
MTQRGRGDEALATVRPDTARSDDGHVCALRSELEVQADHVTIEILASHRDQGWLLPRLVDVAEGPGRNEYVPKQLARALENAGAGFVPWGAGRGTPSGAALVTSEAGVERFPQVDHGLAAPSPACANSGASRRSWSKSWSTVDGRRLKGCPLARTPGKRRRRRTYPGPTARAAS